MDYKTINMNEFSPEQQKEDLRLYQLVFRLNNTMPMTPEYRKLLEEIFADNIGENSRVMPPFTGARIANIRIGSNVLINVNCLAMATGGITIEDDALIGANVQLLTTNHDEYDRNILKCKPIHIKKGAWIGAGATILPGVTVGEHAIVGAASVVTKDVGDCEVVAGPEKHLTLFLRDGEFVCFFPGETHKASIAVDRKPSWTRKIVVKVKL